MQKLMNLPRTWRWMITLYVLITFFSLIENLQLFYRDLPHYLGQSAFLPWLPIPLFYLILTVATSALLLGRFHRVGAFILWLIWREFLSTRPTSVMISDYYIAYALGLLAILPLDWQKYKSTVHNLVWVVLGVTYFYSGWNKLFSPSWINGSAVWWLGQSDLSTSALNLIPMWLSPIISWAALSLELTVILATLYRPLRKYMWICLQLFHISILVSLNIQSLTLGMIIFQMVVYDSDWWKKSNDRV